MKIKATCVMICLFASVCLSFASRAASNRESDFNLAWRFALDAPESSSQEDFDDSSWRTLNVPHDWVIEGTSTPDLKFHEATGRIPGKAIGWYRKTFTANDIENSLYTILFDGVYNDSEVWVNGNKLGFHPYGYTPFHYDLTPFLKEGDDNVIAVRVDHLAYADSRWYTGAGIYRDVHLIVTDKVHVPIWGTFVTTPNVSKDSATVVVQTEISNKRPEGMSLVLKTDLNDADGKTVATLETPLKLAKNEQREFLQTFELPSPRLWDIDTPSLYTANSTILYKSKKIDSVVTRFGIRSIRFDADKGFFLNGNNMKIKGVCLHHDAGLVGTAVPKDVWRRRLEILKEAGCNAIRGAHNPVSNEFLDLCDELGFLVQDEFFDEWDYPKDKRFNKWENSVNPETQGYGQYFQKWAEKDLKTTILSHRNHPSIFQWSIGNEIEWTYPNAIAATGFFDNIDWTGNYFWSEPPFSPDEIRKQIETLPKGEYDIGSTGKKLADWAREMDTTRPITANCILPSASHQTDYGKSLDVMGYSYRRILYDYGHENYPDLPIMGTENVPQWHEWKAIEERDHISGTFLWTGISHMGEIRGKWPVNAADVGLLDLAGFKRPSFHMYKSLWQDEPHLNISTLAYEKTPSKGKQVYKIDNEGNVDWVKKDHWKTVLWGWHDLNEHWNYQKGETTIVEILSNCDEIELFLNDKSLGIQKLIDQEDRVFKWAVPFEEGKLLARGTKDGKAIESELQTHGKPVAIALSSDRDSMTANHYDAAHIVVQLVDANGIPVKSEEREISFDIDEELKLLGVDNGALTNVQKFQSNKITTDQGRALLIVQSKDKATTSKIVATGKGLEDAVANIELTSAD